MNKNLKHLFFVDIPKTVRVNSKVWNDGRLSAWALFMLLRFHYDVRNMHGCTWGNISDRNLYKRIRLFKRKTKQKGINGIIVALGTRVHVILKQHRVNHLVVCLDNSGMWVQQE